MNRATAKGIAEICAAEVCPQLKTIKKMSSMPNMRKDLIVKVRDRLYLACGLMEKDSGAEDWEEYYLPLFDALAFVVDAINHPELEWIRIDTALSCLDALRKRSKRS